MQRLYVRDAHGIVPPNLDFLAQLSQILDQVVGERVVIIEDENHTFAAILPSGRSVRNRQHASSLAYQQLKRAGANPTITAQIVDRTTMYKRLDTVQVRGHPMPFLGEGSHGR